MKKNSKQRLFEMMGKVDTSFKKKLNESGAWGGDFSSYDAGDTAQSYEDDAKGDWEVEKQQQQNRSNKAAEYKQNPEQFFINNARNLGHIEDAMFGININDNRKEASKIHEILETLVFDKKEIKILDYLEIYMFFLLEGIHPFTNRNLHEIIQHAKEYNLSEAGSATEKDLNI